MLRPLAVIISLFVPLACGGKVEGTEARASNTCEREPAIDVDHACLGLSDASGPLLLDTTVTFGHRVGTLFRISGWFARPTAEVDQRHETELTIMPADSGDSTLSPSSDTPTLTWQVAETTCVKDPEPGRKDGIKSGENCLNHFIERWHSVGGEMKCARADDRIACRLRDVRFEKDDVAAGFTASGWLHAPLPTSE